MRFSQIWLHIRLYFVQWTCFVRWNCLEKKNKNKRWLKWTWWPVVSLEQKKGRDGWMRRNDSARWRNKSAADAGLILFWQVDYCCNNIRPVLVMQTVLWPVVEPLLYTMFWSGYSGSGRGGLPFLRCLFSLLLFNLSASYPHFLPCVATPSSGFLPSSFQRRGPQLQLCPFFLFFYFAWTV